MIVKFNNDENTTLETDSIYYIERIDNQLIAVAYESNGKKLIEYMFYNDVKKLECDIVNNQVEKLEIV